MSDTKAPDYKGTFNKLETLLDEYLGHKAPALPENAKETLVSFAPYLAIIGIVFAIPAVFAILGIGAMMGPFSYMMAYSFSPVYYIGVGGLVISAVLDGLAINGLFKRSMGAWRLMYYSSLVTFVASILQGSLSSAILGGLIGMYLLFQVKNKYK